MRKSFFYPKLALGNLIRNKSTYLPYLLACVTSIFTFYTLLAINYNETMQTLPGGVVVSSFTAIGTVLLGIFSIVLLLYTNGFLIKRRKKELGLYSMMGMEKSNIGVVMFFETIFIAAASLVLGIGLGMLLSQLLYVALLRITRFPTVLSLPISWEAVVLTIIFFLLVFLGTMLANLRQVYKTNPVELMAGARQGEKEPKASWIATVIGLVSMGAGYWIAVATQSPVEAILFFLVAAFLVIIGTYNLFSSGSIALLKILRKNKNYYYTPKHFIPLSGMIYRMKQNAAGLASICILSCMVLVTISSTAALYFGAESSLMSNYPTEIQIELTVPADNDIVMPGVEDLLEKHALQKANYTNINSLTLLLEATENGYVSTNGFKGNEKFVEVMLLEDVNRIEGTNFTLEKGQAFTYALQGGWNEDTITIDGIQYQTQPLAEMSFIKANKIGFTNEALILVLPDMEAMQQAEAAFIAETGHKQGIQREIWFDLEGTAEQKSAFFTDLQQFAADTPTEGLVLTNSREVVREGWYLTYGGFMFLGIYFGILFLMAAAMIIYYKQISEGYDDRERFEILQKVGMSPQEVWRTIQTQIRAVFFLPLVVAAIHISVAFVTISRALVVFGLHDIKVFALATVLTVLAYALVYLLVYRRTAKAYYKIVKRVSE